VALGPYTSRGHHSDLLAGVVGGIYLGRRSGHHRQSCHCGAAGVDRDMDNKRRRYLSVDAHDLLGGAQVMGLGAFALSSRDCLTPRRLRDCSLAGLAQFASARRMAGRGALGSSPGCGGVGGVDSRDEKHGVGVVLSFIPPVLRERPENRPSRQARPLEQQLCPDDALRRAGHGRQVLGGTW